MTTMKQVQKQIEQVIKTETKVEDVEVTVAATKGGRYVMIYTTELDKVEAIKALMSETGRELADETHHEAEPDQGWLDAVLLDYAL